VGVARLAVAAATARDVERHRHQVADLDDLDVGADLDDLAGDLMAEDETGRGGGAAADHVLVAPADVGGDRFDDRPVPDLAPDVGRRYPRALLELELGIVGVDDLYMSWPLVHDSLVARHDGGLPSLPRLRPPPATRGGGGRPSGRHRALGRRRPL
jgi:hypothetical protein